MESVDMKKLETAIIYLQRITEGNNPINNLLKLPTPKGVMNLENSTM